MKRLLLLTLLLMPGVLLAQQISMPIDSASNLISYQEVVSVEGASKDELYIRATEWFAKTFKSAQDVIQMDDKSAGKVIGKGSAKNYYTVLMSPVEYYLNYTISITTKEGRYRYEISPFDLRSASSSTTVPLEQYNDWYIKGRGLGYGQAKKIIPHADTFAKGLAKSIKEALQQPAKGIKSKDDF